MLVYGHYPEKINRTPRERFKSKYIVFQEEYHRFRNEELRDMFKDRENRFNINNTMNAENEGQLIYARKIGSKFSLEMRRSANVAFEKWKKKK